MSNINSTSAQAKFVQGSTMRHVVSMTATGSVGLVAVFVVDVLNLLYISQLGKHELAAAVGYASTLLFFHTSVLIGLSIAISATVSRAIGSGDQMLARQYSASSLYLIAAISTVLTSLSYPLLDLLLQLLGARDETAALAGRFCRLILPSIPLLGFGMATSALLRAVGDGKRAMYITLGAALATAALDPLFIFVLKLGLDGAAYANFCARLLMTIIGFWAVLRIHHLFAQPSRAVFQRGIQAFAGIGVPAILTNVATPFGNAAVTTAIAAYGDQAVAGWAVVSRLIPMAFAGLFALSGAVGPILGQNLGARRFDRLRLTMRDSLSFTLIYVALAWLLLGLFSHLVARAFDAQGMASEVIIFFCTFVAGSFIFNGCLFVANAAFNNLGYPFYSTLLNWGRSTLGVIPFVYFGGQWFGARGVLAGYGLGVVVFGIVGIWLCFRVLHQLEQKHCT